jgi:hypothetical protein
LAANNATAEHANRDGLKFAAHWPILSQMG